MGHGRTEPRTKREHRRPQEHEAADEERTTDGRRVRSRRRNAGIQGPQEHEAADEGRTIGGRRVRSRRRNAGIQGPQAHEAADEERTTDGRRVRSRRRSGGHRGSLGGQGRGQLSESGAACLGRKKGVRMAGRQRAADRSPSRLELSCGVASGPLLRLGRGRTGSKPGRTVKCLADSGGAAAFACQK